MRVGVTDLTGSKTRMGTRKDRSLSHSPRCCDWLCDDLRGNYGQEAQCGKLEGQMPQILWALSASGHQEHKKNKHL